MKNYLQILSIIVIAAWFSSSCKTTSLSVEVLKPAEISVPPQIKTLAVINRSLPEKGKDQVNNAIEGILSGEGLFVDREAGEKTVNGVANKLQNSPRFTVTVPNGIDLRGTGTAQFPPPLKWGDIEKICKDYSADALIALETFDSNVGRKISTKEKTKTVDGATVAYTEYNAHLDIGIEAGWRIYYPAEQRIIDQNVFTDHMHWDGVGLSEEEAEHKLPQARYAIKDAGFFAGQQYGYRISPMWVWVGREYYHKANEDFKTAKLHVRAQEWDKAKAIWEKYLNDPDQKIRGYAAFNLALAAEVQGDLDRALELAKQAYSTFGCKKGLGYSRTIQQRIYDQQRLKEQMGD